MGEWIQVKAKDGGAFKAYVAKPAQGSGPGIVLLQEIFGVNSTMREQADAWAAEGYVVVVPDLFWRIKPGIELDYSPEGWQEAFGCFQKFDVDKGIEDTQATLDAMRKLPSLKGKIGAVGYCLGGKLAFLTATRTDVDCSVCYYGVGIEGFTGEIKNIKGPVVMHFAELDKYAPKEAVAQVKAAAAGNDLVTIYEYPGVDHAFARVGGDHWHKPSAMMAYSRSLALFRQVLGPHYNLSVLWDKHCEHEFATRDVNATMATMVAEPYVNHIPTMTGGYGHDHLARFYKYHFIPKTPADTKLIPISRTIGADRVVDEMLFCFTHDIEIDWMLPGIAPTGRYVEIPLVAIVNFRGDKLYNEHIYWDQASVLVQIGKLDPKGLPVAGVETARKLLDPSLPSNSLMHNWHESEGKPIR
ncbi:MAG: dienelactone hydrolase family protein [Geminicoccaceae bacterium]